MSTWDRLSFAVALALTLQTMAGVGTPASAPQTVRSIPSDPARLVEMQHHFADTMLVHDAVLRGDLPSVRQPALRLATAARPSGMPEAAAPFIAGIRAAGQLAADAKTIGAAAQATVAMVTECANCHRAVGIFPAASRRTGQDVGGVIGHMKDHQRALDGMLIGLMIPSQSEWTEGAAHLRVAALLPSQLPKDPKLTKEIRQLDLRVHQIADQAMDADTPEARARTYTTLLGTCAQCHSLHAKIWGPGRGR